MKRFIKFMTNPFILIAIALIISYILCIFLFEKDNLFYIKFLVTTTLSNSLLTNIIKSIYDRETQKEMFKLNKNLQREISEYNKEIIKLTKKLESSNIVHKIQFEKEFSIYIELYEYVDNIYNKIVNLKSKYGAPQNDKEWKSFRNDLELYTSTYEVFNSKIVSYSPFFPDNICKEFNSFINHSKRLISEIKHRPYADRWIAVNLDNLRGSMYTISKLIKKRLYNLKVID